MAAALYRVAHPEIYVPIELARWEPHLARIQAEVEANAELVTDAIELGLDEGAITKRREELAWSERSLAFVAGKMEQIRAKLDR